MSLLQEQASAYLALTSTRSGNRREESAMNIYTGLLFLHGHVVDARTFAQDADFGPTYGNRIASERALRPSWKPAKDAGREDDIHGEPKAA
jgi:hypothetical protein